MAKRKYNPERIVIHFNKLSENDPGEWCIVMDGSGNGDHRLIRQYLDNARIKWTDESCELCLALVDPTPLEVLRARQLVHDVAKSKLNNWIEYV